VLVIRVIASMTRINAHVIRGGGPLAGERFLRTHDAELVPLRIGQHSPGLSTALADVDPASTERKQAVNLFGAVLRSAGEIMRAP
jgi:hypothetical protein